MTLKIISAERILFEGETSVVTLAGEKGRFTVLPHHASLISTLVPGKLRYMSGSEEHEIEVGGGIADIDRDVVSVCIY